MTWFTWNTARMILLTVLAAGPIEPCRTVTQLGGSLPTLTAIEAHAVATHRFMWTDAIREETQGRTAEWRRNTWMFHINSLFRHWRGSIEAFHQPVDPLTKEESESEKTTSMWPQFTTYTLENYHKQLYIHMCLQYNQGGEELNLNMFVNPNESSSSRLLRCEILRISDK